jgi:hypothetical protein
MKLRLSHVSFGRVSLAAAIFVLVMKNNYVYHDCLNMLSAEEVHSGDERPRSQEDYAMNREMTRSSAI